MFGKNKILKPENHDGSSLQVQEIFATFQGEGPYVGYPSVLVRLGGCNLACSFCDTEFDSFKEKTVDEIVVEVLRLARDEEGEVGVEIGAKKNSKKSAGKILRNLVVITGGEPLRQPIEKLCEELLSRGFLVQIETNGTLFRDLPQEVEIICSPKNAGTGYHKIRDDLLEKIAAFKFIISATNPLYTSFGEVGQSAKNIPVYLQPMDEYDEEKNRANVARVLELAAQHGARISLQMHKILKIS